MRICRCEGSTTLRDYYGQETWLAKVRRLMVVCGFAGFMSDGRTGENSSLGSRGL